MVASMHRYARNSRLSSADHESIASIDASLSSSSTPYCLRSLVVRCDYARLSISVADVKKISPANPLWKTRYRKCVIFRTLTRHAR